MGIAYFQKGAVIQLGYRQHVIKREISDGLWQTEEMRTGRMHELTMNEFERFYANGELIFINDGLAPESIRQKETNTLTVRPQPQEDLWTKAKIRRAYAKAAESLPSTREVIEAVAQNVWKKIQQPAKAPHWTSVVRWKNLLNKHGKDIHALVDRNEGKGNRTRRYDDAVIEIVENAIENVFLTRERNSVQTTLEDAIVAVDRENKLRLPSARLPLPSYRLVKGMIDGLPAFDRHAARYGRTAAIRKFRAKLKHVVTDHRLEVAEIDHTKLDLFVLSDDGAIPLGRPWVTVCIDNHTRCILGMYIGFEPPSYLSVARCLKHAFLPKATLREDYPDIKNAWEAHGVMKTLVVDNGLEFHGLSLEQACYSFGIEIEYTPRKSPWFKGKIERFMRTLNEGVCYGTPGTTFSNIFEKDDYDPSKHAVVSISTLRLIVNKWVADYYHQKPHRGLDNVSPAAMWSKSCSPADIPLPENPANIDVMLGKPETAVLSHTGIRINRLFYNSPELNDVRKEHGDKREVEIRVDESNVGHIYVMLPDNSGYIDVPALNRDYAEGVSLWLHDVYRKYAVRYLEKDDPVSWATAKVDIRNIIKREAQSKPKRTNAKLGRYQEAVKSVTGKAIAGTSPTEPLVEIPMHTLKSQPAKPRQKFTVVVEERRN